MALTIGQLEELQKLCVSHATSMEAKKFFKEDW